jgi:hypothetical protein
VQVSAAPETQHSTEILSAVALSMPTASAVPACEFAAPQPSGTAQSAFANYKPFVPVSKLNQGILATPRCAGLPAAPSPLPPPLASARSDTIAAEAAAMRSVLCGQGRGHHSRFSDSCAVHAARCCMEREHRQLGSGKPFGDAEANWWVARDSCWVWILLLENGVLQFGMESMC